MINIPTDREIYEGEIATYWMDDGVLVSLSRNVLRTVENISGNIRLVQQITNNRRVPLLIYLTKSPVPDRKTRKYSTEHMADVYSAMAMISDPGLAKFIMNILFSLQKPPIPMKNFDDETLAKAWLKQYI